MYTRRHKSVLTKSKCIYWRKCPPFLMYEIWKDYMTMKMTCSLSIFPLVWSGQDYDALLAVMWRLNCNTYCDNTRDQYNNWGLQFSISNDHQSAIDQELMDNDHSISIISKTVVTWVILAKIIDEYFICQLIISSSNPFLSVTKCVKETVRIPEAASLALELIDFCWSAA